MTAYPRFLAFSVPSWEVLDADLPLHSVQITRALSTPKALDASLDRKYAHLVEGEGEGDPLIVEWGTVIVVDHGYRVDVFIVDGTTGEDEQETLGITAGGVVSLAKDQPWLPANDTVRSALDAMHRRVGTRRLESGAEAGGIGWVRSTDEIAGVEVDPLDMVRAIWAQITTAPDSDIRLTVDDTTSDVRIGEEERDVEFTTGSGEEVEFTAGPWRLNWHSTNDLGKEIDDLAEETPFEWVEESRWDGELPSTHLRIGYPKLDNPRRDDRFFELGVNVTAVDGVEWADWASEVLVVGQGEGSERRRGHDAITPTGRRRLRRVHVEADHSIRTNRLANQRASKILKRLQGETVLDTVTVADSDAAPFGTWGVGDIITIRGETPWASLSHDRRIVAETHDLTAGTKELTLREVE